MKVLGHLLEEGLHGLFPIATAVNTTLIKIIDVGISAHSSSFALLGYVDVYVAVYLAWLFISVN